MCGFVTFVLVAWAIGCAIASYIMSEKDRKAGKENNLFPFFVLIGLGIMLPLILNYNLDPCGTKNDYLYYH